jgi:hypothetical protein
MDDAKLYTSLLNIINMIVYDYERDLMTMEDREIKFWLSVDKLPNFMSEEEWSIITGDYIERMRVAKENGIRDEKKELINLFKRLEVKDYNRIRNYGKLPLSIDNLIDLDDDNNIVSRKWGEVLFDSSILFEYEDDANERALWYSQVESGADNMYEMWLDYKAEIKAMSGDSITYSASTSDYIIGVDVANGDDCATTTIFKNDNGVIEYVSHENEDEESEWNF